MDCKNASPASDMWGVGVITYLLGKDDPKCRLFLLKYVLHFEQVFFVFSFRWHLPLLGGEQIQNNGQNSQESKDIYRHFYL